MSSLQSIALALIMLQLQMMARGCTTGIAFTKKFSCLGVGYEFGPICIA
jgi:hypothetical protein